MFLRKITTRTRSNSVAIPMEICNLLNVKSGDFLKYDIVDNKIVISKGDPEEQKHYKLERK